jgi:hypothetical protein
MHNMHKLLSTLLGTLLMAGGLQATYAADAPIQKTTGGYQIKYPKYQAAVSANGSMDSLRVGGEEFLNAGVGFKHGSYFYQGKPLEMPDVTQNGANVLTAKGAQISINYTFSPDGMTWTTQNDSDMPAAFFLIVPSEARAAIDEKGQIVKTPTAQMWKDVTFARDRNKLRIQGSDRLWGPFDGNTQVWEQDVAAHSLRKITFEFGTVTAAEVTQIDKISAPQTVPDSDALILSPRNYQVFQRQTKQAGRVLVSGRVRSVCDRVEARIQGKSVVGFLPGAWQTLPLIPISQSFSASLPTSAGGWYKLEVRALKAGQVVAQSSVENVGVGEVFVGAGQSNSTNSGQERIQQMSGMVSAFSGTTWQIANDPQPGTHDNSGGGSFWPAFGDAMYQKYHVPIGVAVTGHGGTSVNQWQPNGELFNWMMTRIYQLGPNGFRAVLWHQGESDTGMTAEDYGQRLATVIQSSNQLAGWEFPWFVAQVSYHNPKELSFATTRDAQKKLWDTNVALEGPDTDTLTGDNRDYKGAGIHFSPKGLRAHGQMWADKVSVWLDRALNAQTGRLTANR